MSTARIAKAADEYVAATGLPHSGGHLEAAFEAGAKWAEDSMANRRWRVFESVFDRTHFGIELEDAGNDDDPILYSMKIRRETVQAIVDAHNASIPTN